jgi:hypothetical protein
VVREHGRALELTAPSGSRTRPRRKTLAGVPERRVANGSSCSLVRVQVGACKDPEGAVEACAWMTREAKHRAIGTAGILSQLSRNCDTRFEGTGL